MNRLLRNSPQKAYQYFRELKNKIVHRYYLFRVNSVQDPHRIFFRKRPYKILFILGHMRAGSSLLTHLMISNPEIKGFGETHIQYSSENDFKTLILKVYQRILDIPSLSMRHQYVLDKILHNNKLLNPDLICSNQVHKIFLLREPKETLASILEIKPHWSQAKALAYYSDRLAMLEQYAKSINSKDFSFFVTYDQLLDNTELVFESLQNFLGIEKGFSEHYEVLSITGNRGVGDSSDNIKTGRIIRDNKRTENLMSPELFEQGVQAFNQCQATLSEYCQTIEVSPIHPTPIQTT